MSIEELQAAYDEACAEFERASLAYGMALLAAKSAAAALLGAQAGALPSPAQVCEADKEEGVTGDGDAFKEPT